MRREQERTTADLMLLNKRVGNKNIQVGVLASSMSLSSPCIVNKLRICSRCWYMRIFAGCTVVLVGIHFKLLLLPG